MIIRKMICDRCNREIQEEFSNEYTTYKGCKRLDLCESCATLLKYFIENPEVVEIIQIKEYIEEHKNNICENCTHYMKNIGRCEYLGEPQTSNKKYTCIGWTARWDDEQR